MRLQLRTIATRDLMASPANIRGQLEEIDDLAASIRATGVLQPLTVNDVAGTYLVTDGHRRLEAARRAGRDHLPCLVSTDSDERTVLATMLAASMHQQLSPLERARAFLRLTQAGVSRSEIARVTGYSLTLISQRLTLLDLPVAQQQLVQERQLTLHDAGQLAHAVTDHKIANVRLGRKNSWFGRSISSPPSCVPPAPPNTGRPAPSAAWAAGRVGNR